MRRLPVILLAAGAIVAPAAALAVPDRQEVQASLGGCPVFPATNVWNKPVDTLPVRSDSATLLRTMGLDHRAAPGLQLRRGGNYGIPYNLVSSATTKVKVRFDYADESDPGPYPIPAKPKIEGGGDRHILMVDQSACRLYELFDARKVKGSGWTAGSGAIWDLRSNALRPDGWTSADAAGLPILPGLARYDEVAAGHIDHALRFTVPVSRRAHIYPARHDAGSTDSASAPPMGLRLRLKASVDISALPHPGTGAPPGAQDLRDDPGRQRLGLLHLGGAGSRLGRRRHAHDRRDQGLGLRGRRHERPGQRA